MTSSSNNWNDIFNAMGMNTQIERQEEHTVTNGEQTLTSSSQAIQDALLSGEVYAAIMEEESTVPAEPAPEASTLLTDNDFQDILESVGMDNYTDATLTEVQEAEEVTGESEVQEENNTTIEGEVQEVDIVPIDLPLENNTQNTSLTENNEEGSDNEVETALQEERETQEETNLLPLNSATLLMDDSTSRFSGTMWYEEIKDKELILAGLGGIGSWTALNLARLHPRMIVFYDPDIVETANMSGQLYGIHNVGMNKTQALRDYLLHYTGFYDGAYFSARYTMDSAPSDIMICGFDNMSARRTFFENWKFHVEQLPEAERKKCLYIDGRLSIDCLQVFAITGDDRTRIKRYQKDELFDDSEADATICSMKQTTYMACMIGNIITNIFVNFVANSLDPIIPYDVPYLTEYEANNMIFKTKV